MRTIKLLLSLIIPSLLAFSGMAQEAYRISAGFSIKTKGDSVQQLTMGTVYYDMNTHKIVYDITFPKPEVWVQKDSLLFRIENGVIVDTTRIPFLAEVTIFHLALNGELPDYGLKSTPYRLEKVSKEAGLVIKTYAPPERYSEELGKVLISNKDRRLHGIIFMDAEGKVLSRQFFEEYTVSKGVAFPARIVQISSSKLGHEVYQVTTYRNITVNEQGKDHLYNYPLRRK